MSDQTDHKPGHKIRWIVQAGRYPEGSIEHDSNDETGNANALVYSAEAHRQSSHVRRMVRWEATPAIIVWLPVEVGGKDASRN